jgi:putative hemolysin
MIAMGEFGVGAIRPAVPEIDRIEGEYLIRFARSDADVREAQRLRFAVFNLELGEGLDSARASGLDEDRFDVQCDHILLCERRTDRVVGTYRLQTLEHARLGHGFYCDEEFDIRRLPERVLAESVELGRACIAREHRNGMALLALWRGMAQYVAAHGKHSLFGCCSLTGTDSALGRLAAVWLAQAGSRHPSFEVPVRDDHRCEGPAPTAADLIGFELPRLFSTYLRFCAKVIGGPAIDRAFGTIDFLVLLDTREFDPRMRAMFFPSSP